MSQSESIDKGIDQGIDKRTKLFYGFGSVAYGVKDNGFRGLLLIYYN
jgi:GPH family glycoside/pentoside/hexuronide:cation symporter